jgi:competence protein ComEC
VLRIRHFRVLEGGRSWRFALRERIALRIQRLYGARAPLVEALVLGRRDDIDPQLRREFAYAGLAHLLAISGLHVGVVAAWLLLVLRLAGARRIAWPLSAVLVWGYVILLGFPSPATRAAGFITLYGIARVRQRHPPLSAVLAVAVLLVLAVDYGTITAVGAWLSVAAVWGTQAGIRLLPSRWRARSALRLAAASFGATVTTAPITAYTFGVVAPAGLLANLVAVPLVTIAVPGVFASLALGETLAGGSGLVLALLERVAAAAARLPGGHLSGAAGPALAAPWAALLAVFIWATRRTASWKVIRRRALVGAVAASWALSALAALGRARDAGQLALHFLDVGQGDAIAIQTPRGQWVVVDAGPRGPTGNAALSTVLPYLRSRGVERLAAVLVSHGDADHLGGVPSVVRALDPAIVLEPGQAVASALYVEYLAVVDGQGVPWRAARRGDTLVVDSVVFAVLHPSAEWIARTVGTNENSLVVRVRYGCFDALLAGDIGSPAEAVLVDSVGEVDVLKVGHHGSAGGTTGPWLDAVRPKVAVISVGRNGYGHPAPGVLARLSARRIATYRTDRGGAVTVRSDGRYLQVGQGEVTTLREKFRCRVLRLLRLSDSFSNKNACTPVQPVTLPACSTISRSPAR